MVAKEIIKEVIFDQKELYSKKKSFYRVKLNEVPDDDEITVISGIRRCGKSTLLNQIRFQSKEKDYFINFDDDRLIRFEVEDFQILYELFIELFGKQKTFYFDEIQNIQGWERFVRRLHDYGNKVYITGSNAYMLSRELGTHLTGRYYHIELYPFSFYETLKSKKINPSEDMFYSTEGKAKLMKYYLEYQKNGGFPAYIQNKNKDYLKSLYESIIYRDVLVKNKLTGEKQILELVHYLVSNVSALISYNGLTKVIGVKNATTVKEYLHFLQNTYLIFLVNKFDYSLKKQIQNPKKVYFIDNALADVIGFYFTENKGHVLENTVFIELKRRAKEVFYHRNKKECDFIITEKRKVVQAVQVAVSLFDEDTEKREIEGLYEAMEMFDLSEGLIITEDERRTVEYKGKKIKIIPVWEWMLRNEEY
ncbi:MAG: ATP-binding protein [Chlorobi bacterium]|nr:ATP-binding protein [Chlorobiota bacterium]